MNENNWFGFDDLFWLTLLVLFLSTLISVLVRRFRRDRCLKLFDDYHITFIHGDGSVIWGDLWTSSQGIEIHYDEPFITSRGLVKSSHLVFDDELGKCLALSRVSHGLTNEEQRGRRKQIEATFNPGLIARWLRLTRNILDMLRDAISKSLGMFMGSMSGRLGAAMASRKGEITDLGNTLSSIVAYAYEPLLERYIGKSVVMEVRCASGALQPSHEFSGYLVEYTEKYIALFNIDQNPVEELTLTITSEIVESTFELKHAGDRLFILCKGPEALVIHYIQDGDQVLQLDLTLLPGCEHSVRVSGNESPLVRFDRSYQIDLICPRGNARIRFGSENRPESPHPLGISPEFEFSNHNGRSTVEEPL